MEQLIQRIHPDDQLVFRESAERAKQKSWTKKRIIALCIRVAP
jgi:hypothetical protein